jgi:hypothetical protein
MDYQTGGTIVFLFLLAIALFSYLQSARQAEAIDRRRRNTDSTYDPNRDRFERR